MKPPAPDYSIVGKNGAGTGLASLILRAGSLRALEKCLKKRWKQYRKCLKRCQEEFSEEAIHDSRVETRRLLALVELLSGFLSGGRVKNIERALKRYLDNFGELRDTQVQLQILRQMEKRFATAHDFCAYLRKREERFSRKTRKGIKEVKTSGLGDEIDASRGELGREVIKYSYETASEMLLGSVNEAFERTKGLLEAIDPSNTATIHCTRVSFKKFRYMLEALADYVPGVDERMLQAMHDYQTSMGDIQDAEVLTRAFDKFVRKTEIGPEPAALLQDELRCRREELIRVYLKKADQLVSFWPMPRPASGQAGANGNGRKRSRVNVAATRRRARAKK